MTTDRIEKRIIIQASPSRIWQALANAEEFGAWFHMRLTGTFTPGARITGRITEPGYEHLTVEMLVERVDPERLFSYRWHPYAVESGVDYSIEQTTLVEFRLVETPGGTELTVVESGFDQIPVARRAEAFRMNDDGWTAQVQNVECYVTGQLDAV